jgi:hypothetical protein
MAATMPFASRQPRTLQEKLEELAPRQDLLPRHTMRASFGIWGSVLPQKRSNGLSRKSPLTFTFRSKQKDPVLIPPAR